MPSLQRRRFLAGTIASIAGSKYALSDPAGDGGAMPPPRGPMRRRAAPVAVGDSCTLPLQAHAPLPVIPASVNGRTYLFGVDTGAMGFARVSGELVHECHLEQAGIARMSDPSGKHPQDVAVFRLASLALGAVHFGELDAEQESHLPNGVSGLLGLDLFEGFVLGFDRNAGRLSLTRGELPSADGKHRFQSPPAPALRLPVSVADQRFSADVDTGQAICPLLVTPDWAVRLGLQQDASLSTAGRTVSQTLTTSIAPNSRIVTAGETTLAVDRIGWPTPTPAPNLGWQAFAGLHLELDRRNNRCRLS
jgi:hypothetical protein